MTTWEQIRRRIAQVLFKLGFAVSPSGPNEPKVLLTETGWKVVQASAAREREYLNQKYGWFPS
jgi:hypothetical protein